ncbi:TetR/AcrR family transcriptional regulator [Amycolatopsis taiwanensis]|uniref:TetR family transcriptional regulator n=1 Tax=Amycolatopsis taiwanensis TaxID=342230 RepID=A0A9W6QWF7_9PSEU|nr:TetR family transcriptional regulator [Amycolatopsis taiwanensis]GLY63901.1 TetR family transcriptional regulator [Amycolatopsis taiwanensis]
MAGLAYGSGRQALLEAAIRVVAREGLRGLTYRAVAAEAGVTHGSVRYHFGDWNTLVEEALVFCAERSVKGAELTSDQPGFEEFASGLVSLVAAAPEAQAFQYELTLEARRRPELRSAMERVNDTYRAAVHRELARNGLTDPDLAEVVFATIDGLVFHQTAFGNTARTERAVNALRSLLSASARAE